MDMKLYKDIIGIQEFMSYFPDTPWFHFNTVLELRWYRDYDYEKWRDRFCVDLKVGSADDKDIILLKLKNVDGEATCNFCGWISGLEINNLKYGGTSYELHYEVLDFEDEHIHFYCDAIEVQVIRAGGVERLNIE